jgi:hypothetical protein
MKKEKNANLEPVILWITLVWKKISGIAEDAKYWAPQVALGAVIIAAICLIVEIFGIAFEKVGVMFFSSIILILTLLIGNWGAKAIAKIIGGVGSLTDETREHSKELAENIKKLFNPLIFIATIVAFVNAWVQMNGFGVFRVIYFYVIVSVVMVLALALKKSRLSIYVMVFLTCASAFFWYADNSNDQVASMFHSKIDVVKQWMGNNSMSDEAKTTKKFGIAKKDIMVGYNVYFSKNKVDSAKEVSNKDTLSEIDNSNADTSKSIPPISVNVIINKVLLRGEVAQIISNKPIVYDGEKLIQVKLMNRSTRNFFNGRKIWIQPELLEIGNNIVSGEGYSAVQTGGGVWPFKKAIVWSVYFQTDAPVVIPNCPLETFTFSGLMQGELKIDDVRYTSGILTEAAMNVACKNSLPTRTFQCSKGKKLIITFS